MQFYLSTRVNSAVIILDTCKASSLINTANVPPNICIVTTSNSNEFSHSSLHVSSLGVSSIDDFVHSIYINGFEPDKSIKEYMDSISKNINSTVSCWGNGEMTFKNLLFPVNSNKIQKFRID